MSALPPLSLYIHFPWCVAKCPYCDFNSHSLRGELPAAAYIDALLADLDSSVTVVAGRTIETIFFGGGTPSLFSPADYQRLLDAVRDCCALADNAEITLEANPGAVEHAAFSGYREAGINRLSLGVQSHDDGMLKSLGRIHTAADAHAAFTEARAAGFDNINLDVMYALPEQTLAGAVEDIERTLAWEPEHISHYHLTLEPNTVFYSRPPVLPNEDLAWDMQIACVSILQAAGYENYEISAWAKPQRQSLHNLNYWRYGDYLGLGAGAHAKLTMSNGQRWRETRAAHPREYMQQVQASTSAVVHKAVSPADARFEFMLNRLRLREGFLPAEYEWLSGQPIACLQAGVQQAIQQGLLAESGDGRLSPTTRGWRFLDDLQAIFLPPVQDSAAPRGNLA
jgi:putative oxygen-independent coproporphyrinogen III oxidase